jgi:8-oxo-dGTP pyrophosphatase MutT (NUDIX family)
MSFLERIHDCNNANTQDYLPFLIEHERVGWVRPALAERLLQWPDLFVTEKESLAIHPRLDDFKQRTLALDEVVRSLIREDVIGHYLAESYAVTAGNRDQAKCLIDRGAVAHFGVRAFGQHINGFVRKADGLYMWIGRRAMDRRLAPGKLDNFVAGGLPHGLSLQENLIKECHEEAGLDAQVAALAEPVGMISYSAETANGIKPDVMYCYDIELPAHIIPICRDGEVESFALMQVEEVAKIVEHSRDFKQNCNLVIIDFLIRHGILGPERKDYIELCSTLRKPI